MPTHEAIATALSPAGWRLGTEVDHVIIDLPRSLPSQHHRKPMTEYTAFYAYPVADPAAAQIAAHVYARFSTNGLRHIKVIPWDTLDISGQLITQRILESITSSDCLIADIGQPDFNVAIEIGYAIGKQKALRRLIAKTAHSSFAFYKRIGIMGTLGLHAYESADHVTRYRVRNWTQSRFVSVPTAQHPEF